MRALLYMLSVSVYKDSPLTVILQACALPLVMYCQRYHTRYLYCLLPGQPQVNRLVFARQLFASHCLCVGGFLAQWRDNSTLKHMTLTRTVVHCMGSGPCQGRLCKSWRRQETCQCVRLSQLQKHVSSQLRRKILEKLRPVSFLQHFDGKRNEVD